MLSSGARGAGGSHGRKGSGRRDNARNGDGKSPSHEFSLSSIKSDVIVHARRATERQAQQQKRQMLNVNTSNFHIEW